MNSKEVVEGYVLSLIEIMENTADLETKEDLDEQIIQMMKDFNIKFD